MTRISALPTQKPAAVTAFRDVLGIAEMASLQAHDTHLWSFLSEAQRADVSSCTGALDCSDALLAAIASKQQMQGSAVYPISGRIILPRGTIRLAATINLSSSVHIIGNGRGQSGGNNGTHLKFDNNLTGFKLHKALINPDTNGADGCILEGLLITGGGTDTTKHGVDLKARAILRDVTIRSFPGNGLNVVADVNDPDRGNANLWYAEFCSFNDNGLSGVHTAGGDANAGMAMNCDGTGNGAWGFWDNSFLGNTYINLHTDANGRNAVAHYNGGRYVCIDGPRGGTVTPGTDATCWELFEVGGANHWWPEYVPNHTYVAGGSYACTNPNARNVFLGCYAEMGSNPPSLYHGPCIVIGGTQANGHKATGGAIVMLDGVMPLSRFLPTPNGGELAIGPGAFSEANCVLGLGDPTGYPYRLKLKTGAWQMDFANLGNSDVLHLYTRAATPANGFARDMSESHGGIGFPTGYYLGAQMIRTTCGDAKPADGTGQVGDRHINTNPAPGGWDGWRRVAGGAWKGYGQIEA